MPFVTVGVDVDDAVPLGLRGRFRRTLRPDASRIDQKVEPAALVDGGADGAGTV